MIGLNCPFCGLFHDFRKGNRVIAFVCENLGDVVHLPFFTKEDIETMKKEAQPVSYKNIFRAFFS